VQGVLDQRVLSHFRAHALDGAHDRGHPRFDSRRLFAHPLKAALDELGVPPGLFEMLLQPGVHLRMVFGIPGMSLEDLRDPLLHGMSIIQPGDDEFFMGHFSYSSSTCAADFRSHVIHCRGRAKGVAADAPEAAGGKWPQPSRSLRRTGHELPGIEMILGSYYQLV
jgi:hypothetical protein